MKSPSLILIPTFAWIAINAVTIPGIKVTMAPTMFTDFFKYHLPTVIQKFESTLIPYIVKDSTIISNITVKKNLFSNQ